MEAGYFFAAGDPCAGFVLDCDVSCAVGKGDVGGAAFFFSALGFLTSRLLLF